MILYEGPSKLNREPIVVVLTGWERRSENPKTGDMLQTWILPQANPLERESKEAVCGDCPLSQRGCYVLPLSYKSVWNAWKRGKYERPRGEDLQELADGRMVRLGSWGDPAAVPVGVWHHLLYTAAGWTGYTHQWRRANNLMEICMASVESQEEAKEAQQRGWRTFRIGRDQAGPGEMVCPASKEAGHKSTCAECGACNGKGGVNPLSVVIAPHGSGKNFVGQLRLV